MALHIFIVFSIFAAVMRRVTLLFALIGSACLSLSCSIGDGRKPLAGGIRDDRMDVGATSGKQDYDTPDVGTYRGFTGLPAPVTHIPEQVLRRTGYVVSYNKDTRLPNWVAWHLAAEHTNGAAKRPSRAFHEDEEVPAPRAEDRDYYNSGYDRGHMCPAADNKWSGDAMLESFLFTNMCPQNHNLNVGDWNEMENQCRRWAQQYGDIYIVCGPVLYKGKHKTIGKNKVVVPEAFFKVVLCLAGTPKAIGFIYKNVAGDRPKGDYVNTVDEVERITGFDFFHDLPDDVEAAVEASCSLSDW